MVIVSKYLIPKGYTAITLFPFIILRKEEYKENAILLNHEKIHLRQQLELLILPFYLWYCIEFLIRLVIHKKWHKAYRNISFEREAYAKENAPGYLKNRRLLSFILFI
ncbi:hypothetical protein [Flavobacterium sp. C4GT6]|uniref:hypothetical protein n=1 Tax=Flavobacterium sp. C4GT6 TaxID=3103818 RepID=UPI002ED2A742